MPNYCSAPISIIFFLMNTVCKQLVKFKIPHFIHIFIEYSLFIGSSHLFLIQPSDRHPYCLCCDKEVESC